MQSSTNLVQGNTLFTAHRLCTALVVVGAWFGVMLVGVSNALASIEESNFANEVHAERYQNLIEELRCLVCQNQTIADSDASLAKDLRRKTSEMIVAGKSDGEIRNYMRERYGDFVLYNPPFEKKYWALWLLPIVLLVIVIALLVRYVRGRNSVQTLLSDTDQGKKSSAMKHAAQLLESNDSTQNKQP